MVRLQRQPSTHAQATFTVLSGEVCPCGSLEREGSLTEVWRETAR
ncbi:hypothetical protein XM38_015370 [Halomicronema hongdechloris C2206]|uniref:Uncharacterized protein n=1 Tax=Halomicronema hongdechloris C2206 TaxID=1641165 RepID=A0A1Z3HKH8_9CYAN|nr:hypothetical protein XM38_015370 [Halomicronema hongdechloris C2206]